MTIHRQGKDGNIIVPSKGGVVNQLTWPTHYTSIFRMITVVVVIPVGALKKCIFWARTANIMHKYCSRALTIRGTARRRGTCMSRGVIAVLAEWVLTYLSCRNYHLLSIPTACKQLEHNVWPRIYHTLSPTALRWTAPLVPPSQQSHQPVWYHDLNTSSLFT